MYAYDVGIIDFWNGWTTESQYFDWLEEQESDGFSAGTRSEYEALRSEAFELARKIGWEGDVVQGPFVGGIPTGISGQDGRIMIAWKQHNNGITFVVSPIHLPWLEQGKQSSVRVDPR